ncbi:Protein of uncharacterised function (DUF3847) [Allocoprococcus comes]|nr:Protein of uncharacterised function (DUF3847) [Coprococcus comes]
MPDTSKLEKLNRELEKSEKKLRKAINDEKALQHQLKQLTRKERTHRLCTRGGMGQYRKQLFKRLVRTGISGILHDGLCGNLCSFSKCNDHIQ